MRNIKISMLFIVLLGMVFVFCGCGKNWHGLGETAAERNRRKTLKYSIEQQQLVDDVDLLFMNDRPSRLTKYKVR